MSQQQNFVRKGIHHFVYGLCAMAIGITPPSEKQEVLFFLILVGFLVFTALAMYLVATIVPTLFR